jgi:uncharacterized membrane protein
VQLSRAWIAIAWAIEGVLLVRSGLRVDTQGIRILGYVALGLAFINALFWGSLFSFGERTVSYLVVIVALFLTSYLLSKEKLDDAQKVIRAVLFVLGALLLTVMLAVEISDSQGLFSGLPTDAIEAVIFIILGFTARSLASRIIGAVLFGITVLKILIFDLDNLDPISRTIVTIIVGVIALGAAFAYIKNKDKIQAYLEEKHG